MLRLPRSKKLELQTSQMKEVGCDCILCTVSSSREEKERLQYEHLMTREEEAADEDEAPPLPPPRPLLPLPRPELDGAAVFVDDEAGLSKSEMSRRR